MISDILIKSNDEELSKLFKNRSDKVKFQKSIEELLDKSEVKSKFGDESFNIYRNIN
jgi:hypothetical protein